MKLCWWYFVLQSYRMWLNFVSQTATQNTINIISSFIFILLDISYFLSLLSNVNLYSYYLFLIVYFIFFNFCYSFFVFYFLSFVFYFQLYVLLFRRRTVEDILQSFKATGSLRRSMGTVSMSSTQPTSKVLLASSSLSALKDRSDLSALNDCKISSTVRRLKSKT